MENFKFEKITDSFEKYPAPQHIPSEICRYLKPLGFGNHEFAGFVGNLVIENKKEK